MRIWAVAFVSIALVLFTVSWVLKTTAPLIYRARRSSTRAGQLMLNYVKQGYH